MGCLGDAGRCGLAGRGTPAALQGSERGPRHRVGSGFSGELNHTSPCGVSLPGLPADPGSAFQRFPAMPHGTSPLRLSAPPCPSVWGRWRCCGAAGHPEWLWHPGRCGLAGRGAPVARHGSGRGPRQGAGYEPRHGVGSGFSGQFNHPAPSGASLLFLRHIHAAGLRRSPALQFGVVRAAGSCGMS